MPKLNKDEVDAAKPIHIQAVRPAKSSTEAAHFALRTADGLGPLDAEGSWYCCGGSCDMHVADPVPAVLARELAIALSSDVGGEANTGQGPRASL